MEEARITPFQKVLTHLFPPLKAIGGVLFFNQDFFKLSQTFSFYVLFRRLFFHFPLTSKFNAILAGLSAVLSTCPNHLPSGSATKSTFRSRFQAHIFKS